ncbi:MAG: hypothetical protein J7621_23070, partial [Niastella sp.]|nr:hypothetical protein [Niastella sp.]
QVRKSERRKVRKTEVKLQGGREVRMDKTDVLFFLLSGVPAYILLNMLNNTYQLTCGCKSAVRVVLWRGIRFIMKLINLLIATGIFIIWACNSGTPSTTTSRDSLISAKPATPAYDTAILQASFQQADTAYNDYLAAQLAPIRANFKRINSISKWTSTSTKALEETTEGGEATFYYVNGVLEKIATRHFGETFQQLTEYYLLNGQLSFVFEKALKYNRPIYYDSAAMKEGNDDEVFDIKKSQVEETRSYFNEGKLLHQVNNQDCGSPFSSEYLAGEQKRFIATFEQLKTMR